MAGSKFGGWMDAAVADILNRIFDGSLERDVGNQDLIDALTRLSIENPASAAANLINEYAPVSGKRTYNPLDVLHKKVEIDYTSPTFTGELPVPIPTGDLEPLPAPDPYKEAEFADTFAGWLASTGMALNPVLRRAARRLERPLYSQAILQPEIYGTAGEGVNPFMKFLQSGKQLTGQALLDRLNMAATLVGINRPEEAEELYGAGTVPVTLRQQLAESPENQFMAFLAPLIQGVDPRVSAAYQNFYQPTFERQQITEPATPFLQWAKRQNLGGYWQ